MLWNPPTTRLRRRQTMISSNVVDALRAAAAQFLSDRAVIEREEKIIDALGAWSSAWIGVRASEPCRLIQMGTSAPGAAITSNQEGLRDSYKLEVRHDAPLAVDYRVTINGVTYYVTRIEDALTNRVFKSAVVERR